jgi:hypothetical protein
MITKKKKKKKKVNVEENTKMAELNSRNRDRGGSTTLEPGVTLEAKLRGPNAYKERDDFLTTTRLSMAALESLRPQVSCGNETKQDKILNDQ